jgi:UDP-N-acetylmuramoyl-tripeptide--D-alanyl-D-alanine ligase
MTIQEIHKLFLSCNSAVIDSRKIEINSFFVALKGERFDANIFAKEALKKGASYVLIDNQEYYIGYAVKYGKHGACLLDYGTHPS